MASDMDVGAAIATLRDTNIAIDGRMLVMQANMVGMETRFIDALRN